MFAGVAWGKGLGEKLFVSREEVGHAHCSAPRGWGMCKCVKLLLESSGSCHRRLFEAFFFI